MLFRFIIILLLINNAFSESLFNRVFPQEYYLGDARSMGMGNTFLSTGKSSMIVFSNPAKIVNLKKTFDIQFSLNSVTERRSIVLVDGYGGFITESDYVINQHNYLNHSFGLLLPGKNNLFGFGISQAPIYSFNYDYEEEVRADGEVDYGEFENRDPLIGYHILSTSGDLFAQSFGISFQIINSEKNKVSLGTSLNKIKSSKINDKLYVSLVDESYYEDNNITPTDPLDLSYIVNSASYSTSSLELLLNNSVNLILSFEQDVVIKTKEEINQIEIPDELGLPLLLNLNDESGLLQFLPRGLIFNKPEKHHFGLTYKSKNNSKILVAFELTRKKWNYNNYQEAFNNKTFEYRLGFEYNAILGFPLRAGFVYSESQFKMLEPKTIITLGTGKKFKKVTLDFALNNSNYDYKYYDLFPDRDIFNMSCDEAVCDKIKENNLNLLTTIKVNF